eukprot:Blabericola_migrator_1__4652@NODE_2463_length_2722_cov_816_590960_g1541_i0_p1_GENE_NODE_2463_length_2722_cov_816_590960_g1541_i0NODE_2463_length_2722_cov_816_590960_g1541_i0_p1_ORF_typecomplete_len264_score42_75Nitroreductase/PF00881_24/8_7e24TM1586_NiRdase/PF14512_6/4_7e12UPF0014/PF03649_13/0_2_NODE_2463_length_2722_cov_816_590960_g1541_i07881579
MTSQDLMNVLLHQATCRSYVPNKPLSSNEMEQILLAGRQTPTSCNSQLISVIVVEDNDLRKRILTPILDEIAATTPMDIPRDKNFMLDSSAFFVICGDLYKGQVAVSRVSDAPVVTHETSEGLITLCVDAGSVMRSMIAAAHSLGLGTCPIGMIRAKADTVAQVLELPQKVIPIIGLCIGHMVEAPPVKPRLDMSTFAHVNKYHAEDMEDKYDKYNEILREHYLKHGRSAESFGTYSQSMNWVLTRDLFPRIKEQFGSQGYKF